MTVLTLVKLRPDGIALARWASSKAIAAFKDDLGYAAHAASKAVFGDLAPKPFALRMKDGGLEMVGYSGSGVDELSRVAALQTHDDLAAAALGVDSMIVKAMPSDWKAGERFSFECRVVPTRRSRRVADGRYLEVDAAVPEGDEIIDREAAYSLWLTKELERFSAARLTGFAPHSFKMTSTVRRTQDGNGGGGGGLRRATNGLVPDLVARGEFEVVSPQGLCAALTRGLGRHRAFGYGCLLLAPRGVLFRPTSKSQS